MGFRVPHVVIAILLYIVHMSNTKHTPPIKKDSKQLKPSGSWVVERDALKEYGDRKSRAILAIFTARRSSGKKEFFVSPHIADLYNLTPRDLNWALNKLDGIFINTIESKPGKFRLICLTPEWEAREANKAKARQNHPTNMNNGEELVIIDKADTLKNAATYIAACDDDTHAILRAIATEG